MSVPVAGWRLPEPSAERSGEGFMRLVSSTEGDVNDCELSVFELERGPFQAQSSDVLTDRFTHHSAEDAVEMERGEARQLGQVLQAELLVEVILDMHQDLQDPLSVVALSFLGATFSS
jgi:hypothetical protein